MKTTNIVAFVAILVPVAANVIEARGVDTEYGVTPILNASSEQESTYNYKVLRPAQGFDTDETASEADWIKFSNKGGALMCGLLGTDETAGQQLRDTRSPPSAASEWRGDLKQELSTWYWRERDPTRSGCEMDEFWQIPTVMKALGLNARPASEGGDNACFRVEHWDPNKEENGRQVPPIDQWYQVGDKMYRVC